MDTARAEEQPAAAETQAADTVEEAPAVDAQVRHLSRLRTPWRDCASVALTRLLMAQAQLAAALAVPLPVSPPAAVGGAASTAGLEAAVMAPPAASGLSVPVPSLKHKVLALQVAEQARKKEEQLQQERKLKKEQLERQQEAARQRAATQAMPTAASGDATAKATASAAAANPSAARPAGDAGSKFSALPRLKQVMEARGRASAVLMDLLRGITNSLRDVGRIGAKEPIQRIQSQASAYQAELSRLRQMQASALDEKKAQAWRDTLGAAVPGGRPLTLSPVECHLGRVAWNLSSAD
jgi:DNA-binding protein H-NS